MMLIDTHMHFDTDVLEEKKEILRRSKENSVTRVIASYCEKESLLKSSFPNISGLFYSFGFHPSEASFVREEDLLFLKKKLITVSNVVALGEIGLDYHYGKENREAQLFLFEEQLQLASELGLPVVIHSRDATFDTLETLKKYKVRGVIHCFNGSVETAKEYIKMGFYLGIGGIVTFSNSKLYQVIEEIGLSSVVLETDSPYLAPVPHRGKPNEPAYVFDVAQYLSQVLSLSLEEVALVTTKNACSLFDLKKEL